MALLVIGAHSVQPRLISTLDYANPLSVVYSPDGSVIGIQSSSRFTAIDANTLRTKFEYTTDDACVQGLGSGVVYSPDGNYVAFGAENKIVMINIVSEDVFLELTPENRNFDVLGLGFSPDGEKIIAGSQSGRVCVWDIRSEKLLHDIKTVGVLALAVLSESEVIVAGYSAEIDIQIYDYIRGAFSGGVSDCTSFVSSLIVVRNKKDILIGTGGRQIISRDIESGATKWNKIDERCCPGQFLSISPDGSTLVTAVEDKLMLLSVADGTPILEWVSHTKDGIFSASFRPDSKVIVSGGYDDTVKLWDIDQILVQQGPSN